MKNLFFTFLFGLFTLGFLNAQTLDDLKSMKADKQAKVDALAAEIADIDGQILKFPGWQYGGVGVVGFDLNGNNNWFAINRPNSSATGYGLGLSGFANRNADKTFWRNLLTLNLRKVVTTLDTNLADGSAGNEVTAITDALDVSSLFGYKLSEKWALSVEGKYQTVILNFNNPGKLVASAGLTWLPIDNLVVLIHPLGYEKNWPGDLISSAGAKIGATYAGNLIKGIAWTSNLSAFIPYSSGTATLNQFNVNEENAPQTDGAILKSESQAYTQGDLVNWTWINGFSTSLWKGVGLGLNIGLRADKQLADNSNFQRTGLRVADNPLQSYYTLGLSYTF